MLNHRKGFLIVTGTGRSGTQAFRAALDIHSEYRVQNPEIRKQFDLDIKYPYNIFSTEMKKQEFVDALYNFKYHTECQLCCDGFFGDANNFIIYVMDTILNKYPKAKFLSAVPFSDK